MAGAEWPWRSQSRDDDSLPTSTSRWPGRHPAGRRSGRAHRWRSDGQDRPSGHATPQSSPLLHHFVTCARDSAIVRAQDAVRLNLFNQPEPDIALLNPRAVLPRRTRARPISCSSSRWPSPIGYGRTVKAELYARLGVARVLVGRPERQRRHESHRAGRRQYRRVEPVAAGELFAPAELPACRLTTADIFGCELSAARPWQSRWRGSSSRPVIYTRPEARIRVTAIADLRGLRRQLPHGAVRLVDRAVGVGVGVRVRVRDEDASERPARHHAGRSPPSSQKGSKSALYW